MRDIKYFFYLSRPFNVFISLLTFGVACFIATGQSLLFLKEGTFWATAATIGVIAATGYWINDVYDFRIDRINKPNKTIVNAILSVKKVLTAYFAANFSILIFSGILITYHFREVQVTFINVLSILLLFIYASYLKRVSVAGNLVIAFLIALVIILAGYLYNINLQLVWTMVFAFQITLIREITKDIEDIRGDLQFHLKTLPIQVGIRNTKKILLFLYICFWVSCYMPILVHYYEEQKWLTTYGIISIFIVQIPLFWVLRKMLKSAKPDDFSIQSKYLKYIMLSGIMTLFFL